MSFKDLSCSVCNINMGLINGDGTVICKKCANKKIKSVKVANKKIYNVNIYT